MAVLRAFPRICKALCWRPDILHAHVYEAGFPAGVLGWRRRIPMVLTEHITTIPGGDLTAGGRLKARWAMRTARCVLPVSESLKEAIQKLGVTSHLRVLPNAVDTSLFHPGAPPATPRLLYVGSLIPRKDVTTLLEALSQLTAKWWDLDLVGDGEERPKLEALVRRLELRDRCRFHGRQPKTRIASLMRHSSALVLPSRSENLPCVVIEAMASGLPVLATRVGGLPEMVSEETGILVPPADVEALREGLSRILATSFDAQRIANRAQRFSLHAVGDRLHAIYKEVTRGAADAPGGIRDGVESSLRE